MADPLQTHLERQGVPTPEAEHRARTLRQAFEHRTAQLEQGLSTVSSPLELTALLDTHRAALERSSRPPPGQFPPVLACKAGCTPCCHLRVKTSPAEVLSLAAHLRTLPAPQREGLERRVRRAAKQARRMTPAEWNVRGPGCPLLEEGQCSAYVHRPLSCRAHHSLELKPCQKLHARGEGGIPADPHLELTGMQFVAALGEAAGRSGLQADSLELTTALEHALSDDTAFERWLSGERVFAVGSS